MSEYTAEDFKNARFADHEDGRAAMRPRAGGLWDLGGVRMGDPGMAFDGWRPVVEADHPTRPLAGYRAQVKGLREKVRDLERDPLTLDTLREAWENAEVPTLAAPVGKGDVLIRKDDDASIDVWECQTGYHPAVGDTRVLSRAPQPEPWQALADEMEALYDGYSLRAAEAAQFLHERGVRVTGGDET